MLSGKDAVFSFDCRNGRPWSLWPIGATDFSLVPIIYQDRWRSEGNVGMHPGVTSKKNPLDKGWFLRGIGVLFG